MISQHGRHSPRTHSLPRRSKPGSTPSGGGQTPDRHPHVAVKPRIDHHSTPSGWRSNPGSTPSRGGQTPDRHPHVAVKPRLDTLKVAVKPRIDTLRWRSKPGSTTTPLPPRSPSAGSV